MRFRWERLALLALLLLPAGCFRPAGDSIEPTNGQPVTLEPPTGEPTPDPMPTITVLEPASPTPQEDESILVPTATEADQSAGGDLPPITVLSPATSTLQPTPESLGVEALQVTIITPGETPALTEEVAATPQFITPGVPLGPITPEVPTLSLTLTSTPSGLTTPTALPGDVVVEQTTGGDPVPASNPACVYTVRAGDNLFRIAVNNNTTVAEMRTANPSLVGENPLLQPGQTLVLPNCGTTGQTPAQPVEAAQPTAITPPIAQPPVAGTTYTVQAGDTLFSIARRNGVTVQQIIDANNLSNPDRLDVGQQLIIPSSGG